MPERGAKVQGVSCYISGDFQLPGGCVRMAVDGQGMEGVGPYLPKNLVRELKHLEEAPRTSLYHLIGSLGKRQGIR
jgi:hypothetical protein